MAIVDNQTVELPQHQQQHGDEQTTDQEEQPQDQLVDDDYRIFIGGLTQDTNDTDISTHFSNFGKVTNVSVVSDVATGRSRGFAFAKFESVAECDAACAHQSHIIKGKRLAVRKAENRPCKVYVDKLKLEFTEDDIKRHFQQFGTVTAVDQPFDKMSGEKRNHCFVTFANGSIAKTVLKQGTTVIKGQECDLRKVTARPNKIQGGYDQGYGAVGGGGGGRDMSGGYGKGGGYGIGGYGMGGYGIGGYGMGGRWGGAAQMQGQWQYYQHSGMGDVISYGQGYGVGGSVAAAGGQQGNSGGNSQTSNSACYGSTQTDPGHNSQSYESLTSPEVKSEVGGPAAADSSGGVLRGGFHGGRGAGGNPGFDMADRMRPN